MLLRPVPSKNRYHITSPTPRITTGRKEHVTVSGIFMNRARTSAKTMTFRQLIFNVCQFIR